ncbi:uncharacterized protein LOC119113273 [Pollicipes pollicipes]|uniref:uncharacterized protein LOC119113273 n=1 Tax=Pollicipes pollicipes TaxID=41117 RepID=UPI0018858F74|nr:uncharacterized protein LOC119113273 [Pollicipes pollicipes]
MIRLAFTFFIALPGIQGMACFHCVSINGSMPSCEDPFSNIPDTLSPRCTTTWKNRQGLFPSSACIKLAGVVAETGAAFVVRTCSVDGASLTSETELSRSSHCGSFVFDGELVYGCVKSCDSFDGCNRAVGSVLAGWSRRLPLLLALSTLLP